MGHDRHHRFLEVKCMARQAHEGGSKEPNILGLSNWGPRKTRSAPLTASTHCDLQEDARVEDPISPP